MRPKRGPKKRTRFLSMHLLHYTTVSLLEERAPCCCKPRPCSTQFSIQERPERKVSLSNNCIYNCCVQKGLQCLQTCKKTIPQKAAEKSANNEHETSRRKMKILCVSVATKIILSASGSVASAAVPSAQRAANGQWVRVSNYAFRF